MTLPWVVALGSGVLLGVALFGLLHRLTWRWLKFGVPVFAALLAVVPAPVPNYAGQIAPAFVVFIFEAYFQTDGEPQQALTILVGAAAVIIAAIVGLFLFVARRSREAASAASDLEGDLERERAPGTGTDTSPVGEK